MGAAGAAVVGMATALILGIGLALAVVVFRALRTRPRSGWQLWSMRMLGANVAVLTVGLALPKSFLRALAWAESGRVLLGVCAAAGLLVASIAWQKRQAGGMRAWLAHAYFAAVAATPAGHMVFHAFFMM